MVAPQRGEGAVDAVAWVQPLPFHRQVSPRTVPPGPGPRPPKRTNCPRFSPNAAAAWLRPVGPGTCGVIQEAPSHSHVSWNTLPVSSPPPERTTAWQTVSCASAWAPRGAGPSDGVACVQEEPAHSHVSDSAAPFPRLPKRTSCLLAASPASGASPRASGPAAGVSGVHVGIQSMGSCRATVTTSAAPPGTPVVQEAKARHGNTRRVDMEPVVQRRTGALEVRIRAVPPAPEFGTCSLPMT